MKSEDICHRIKNRSILLQWRTAGTLPGNETRGGPFPVHSPTTYSRNVCDNFVWLAKGTIKTSVNMSHRKWERIQRMKHHYHTLHNSGKWLRAGLTWNSAPPLSSLRDPAVPQPQEEKNRSSVADGCSFLLHSESGINLTFGRASSH